MNTFDKIFGIVIFLFMIISIICTLLIDWIYIFMIPPGFFSFYLIYKHSFEGRFHITAFKNYEEKIANDYDNKFRTLINEVTRILRNNYFFYYLCLEDFISSLRYKFDSRITKILNKGWSKYKKSSKKVLISYGELYKDLYGAPFNFLSSFLIALLVIKKDFYSQIQEKMDKNDFFKVNARYEMQEIYRVAQKMQKENIDFSYNEDERKYFSLEKFRKEIPSDNTLYKYKNNTLNDLREIKSKPQMDLNIEVIIKVLENCPLEYWNKMKIYKRFLIETMRNTPEKYIYEYLNQNGFDFNEWIIPDYRHKVAHPKDFRPFKYQKKLYAMKVINSEKNPRIIQIQDLCDAVRKILSIINYMYEAFFTNKFAYQNSKFKEFKIDLKKIHKTFETTDISIH